MVFWLLYMNNVTMNSHLLVFVWIYIFIFLDYIPKSGIAVSYDNLWEIFRFSPKGLHHFAFPPAVYEGSSFSTSLPTFVFHLSFSYYGHSSKCEMTSHCGFNLYFPHGSLYMYLSSKGMLRSLHQELESSKRAIMLEGAYFMIMEEKEVIWSEEGQESSRLASWVWLEAGNDIELVCLCDPVVAVRVEQFCTLVEDLVEKFFGVLNWN